MSSRRATRIKLTGDVAELPRREQLRDRARELGAHGWVRLADDGSLLLHVEGEPGALGALRSELRATAGIEVTEDMPVKAEGHEQFAIRGVPAGVFVVQEHHAGAHRFDVRLEVGGVMRSWVVAKGPSMDPAVKRFAIGVEDHPISENAFEGATDPGGVIIWDRGSYEQGGRVAWPEAIDRGHAVFVLHGEKLRGGFALQRTRSGDKPQWLLVKRRDQFARPGSDVVAELPQSVASGRTLEALLAAAGR